MAGLVNAHPITLSRWESAREKRYTPSPYQESFLEAFKKASANDPTLKERLATTLLGAGVATAMFAILRAAFPDAPR